jgi:hypothetical protein
MMQDSCNHNTVRNNVMYIYHGLNLNYGANTNYIYNNTFVSNLNWTRSSGSYPAAVSVDGPGDSHSNIIKNNICQDFLYECIGLRSGTGNVADYNCKYMSDGSTPGGQGQQTHDIWMQDPKINNAGGSKASDYQVASNSPCVDAGESIAEITNDYEGISRPQGTGFDMGAFESRYGGGNPPSPPADLRIVE